MEFGTISIVVNLYFHIILLNIFFRLYIQEFMKNYGINSLHFNLGQIKENKLSKNENYKISQQQTILTYIY